MKIILILLLFCSTVPVHAQSQIDSKALAIPKEHCHSVDALSKYIKENFAGGEERLRAIYVWVTDNISYDVAAFLSRDETPKTAAPSAQDILTKRSGVCQGYTDLFTALCKAVDINVLRIPGYTKYHKEIAGSAHAWVAAELDGVWYLLDPTWGAGYVNNNRFTKRFNNEFYKMAPEKFIERHMPFDPIHQMLAYPITNQEFIDGKPVANTNSFNYKDSIKFHYQLSPPMQTAAELRRLQAAGLQHKLLQDRSIFLRNKMQSVDSRNSFEEGLVAYRKAVDLYKALTAHRKTQFASIADNDLKQAVDSIEFHIKNSRALIAETVAKTDAQWKAKTGQTASIDKLWTALIQQKDFIAKYIATDKEKRKFLFMR
ncbi:MAG: hypothetical protein EOO03_01125 [Chitinophagaceae bacterium]|nr:MAG: hypothetical protein EOO03_01125 [Chitinophagaceae bacterium]